MNDVSVAFLVISERKVWRKASSMLIVVVISLPPFFWCWWFCWCLICFVSNVRIRYQNQTPKRWSIVNHPTLSWFRLGQNRTVSGNVSLDGFDSVPGVFCCPCWTTGACATFATGIAAFAGVWNCSCKNQRWHPLLQSTSRLSDHLIQCSSNVRAALQWTCNSSGNRGCFRCNAQSGTLAVGVYPI